MTSSTTLYTSPGNAGNVASKNFTTLYSGSGSINPTQPYGNANVVGLLAAGSDGANTVTNIIATGNVTAAYFIGNVVGNIIGNVVVPGANTQVLINNAGNLGASPGLTFDTASNVLATSGSVTAVGNIQGNYFLGNGSQLTGLPATYGNADVSAYLASGTNTANIITSANVQGGNIKTVGQVTATGNVTGAYILGNGSQLTGLPATYGNANVVSLLAAFGSNSISTTGNVTASYVIGNGSLLTNITAGNIIGQVANALVAGTVYTAAQPNITSVGILTAVNTSGNISATGNITGAYLIGNITGNVSGNSISVSGNITGGNLLTPGDVSATGNVTGAYIAGNGSLLTNITGANVTGNVLNAQYVTQPAQANITSVGTLTSLSVTGNTTSGNISAVGNINGANLTLTADALIQGNLTVNGNTTFINSNVVTINDKFINVANNASTAAQANGGGLGVGPVGGEYATLEYLSTPNVWSTNIGLSVNGNVSAGNVSATGIAGTLSTAAQPNITSVGTLTSLSVTGNVTAGNVATTVVSATSSAGLSLKNSAGTTQASMGAGGGDNFTISVSTNITGANAQIDISPTGNSGHVHIKPTGTPSVEIAPTYTGSINNMIIGNITPVAVNATTVSATGNVTGAYIIGNGSLLTNITGANVTGNVLNAQYVTQPAQANITSVGTLTSLSVTGNVTAGNLSGTNVTGTLSTAAQPNITSVGTLTSLSVTGNVSSGNVINTGTISSTGNITAPNFIGNIIGNVDAGGSNTQIQFNDADLLAGNVAMTFDKTAGNIGLGNLIIGSGNTAAVGAGQRINTIGAFTGVYSNTATANFGNAQIVIGNGYFGNLNLNNVSSQSGRAAKVVVWDSANVSDAGNVGVRYTGLAAVPQIVLTGNIANVNNSSFAASGSILAIGGGASGNSYINTQVTGVSGATFFVNVGQPSAAVPLGNTTVGIASGTASRVQVFANSVLTTAVGGSFGTANNGNITNNFGASVQFNNGSTGGFIPSRVYGLYMGNATNTYGGIFNSNTARSAGEYYFLRNDDAVAQTQLGTLRSYNEFNYVNPTTSGALTVDKNNAQIQQINLTGNISGITYANMVSSLSDSVTTDEEADTVTLIFNQGSTGGYSVTFPTGSTYKYAGNLTTIGTTANSVSMVSVTVIRLSGTPTYLTTISPEFV